MLSLTILVPAFGALLLAFTRNLDEHTVRRVSLGLAAVPLVLLLVSWLRFDVASATAFQLVEEVPWIPALGVAWRLGVDGISLSLSLMSAILFLAAIAWPMENADRQRQYYAWFLFLQSVSIGLFLVLDLLLFYVFFDLSLVGMFFLLGRWGHEGAERAALKFFIYTLAGSLAILLAIIMLVLASEPMSFDMRVLIDGQWLAGNSGLATLVFVAFMLGFAIKTPLFPVHTWLPPAHVKGTGPVSAILAGVLLKMGTYGIIRMPLQMMRETFASHALPIALLALVSILWGAIVALGQTNLKRRIAYTSVNHMGYSVLGIAAAGALMTGEEASRQLALTGAVVEMVAHGLITGSLFLIAGAIWARTGSYELDSHGGLARLAPKMTVLTVIATFASFGLPGLAGFVAEIQIFIGAFAIFPWIAGIGLLGILLTAALFLRLLQDVFFGDLPDSRREFSDLGLRETWVLGALVTLVVVIGVYPRWLLALIDGTTAAILGS